MLKKHYLLGSIALFFLSGCASITSNPASHNDKHHNKQNKQSDEITDKDIAPHVLAIDPDGKLNFIGCDGKDRATLDWCGELSYEQKLDNYLNNIITNLKASNKELLIYVHGGLNKEKNALERAKKKYKLIRYDKKNPRYPLFVTWNSEGLKTYKEHIVRIRQGEQEKHSLTNLLTIPVYLFTDLANSLANAPKAWTVTGKHMISSTLHAKDNDDINADIKELWKTNVSFNGDKDKSGGVGRKIRWVVTSPFKVITTPFTYTLAKPAWDIMLRRTSTLLYTPDDLDFEEQSKRQGATIEEWENEEKSLRTVPLKPGNGALYRFLSALEEDDEASNVNITLIGHSMGAIIVNNIVNLGLDLTYKNIVHMASADSTESLLNKVVPYIDCSLEGTCNKSKKNKEGTKVNFYSLYLHPDNENREVSAQGFTPSGSLLTWIDSMYTIPKTVLDKRSGRWDNMRRAIRLIPPVSKNKDILLFSPALNKKKKQNNIKGQMHFTIFGLQERKPYDRKTLMNSDINLDAFPEECEKDKDCLYPTAQEHGDFGDLPFWREEIWKGEPLSVEANNTL